MLHPTSQRCLLIWGQHGIIAERTSINFHKAQSKIPCSLSHSQGVSEENKQNVCASLLKIGDARKKRGRFAWWPFLSQRGPEPMSRPRVAGPSFLLVCTTGFLQIGSGPEPNLRCSKQIQTRQDLRAPVPQENILWKASRFTVSVDGKGSMCLSRPHGCFLRGESKGQGEAGWKCAVAKASSRVQSG